MGGVKLGHVGGLKYGSIGGVKAGRIGGLKYGSIGKIYGHSLLGAANPNAEEDSDMDPTADAGLYSEHGQADHHMVGMEHPSAMYDHEDQMVGAPNPNSMQMQEYGMMQPQMNSMMEMARGANEGQMMGANAGIAMSHQMGHHHHAMMYADDGQMVGAEGPNAMLMPGQQPMGEQEMAMTPYAMYVNEDQVLALSQPMHEQGHGHMMHQSMYPSNISPRSANPYQMMRADGMPISHQASPAMYNHEQHHPMVGAPQQTVISISIAIFVIHNVFQDFVNSSIN